jgi:Mce-associated membrane protein
MTDPAVDPSTRSEGPAGPAGTSWRWANIVLIVLALVLVATSALLFTKGAAATPGDSEAEALSRQYEKVTAAARGETRAFLTVDYKNMDPLTQKVLAGATGTFKEQYERARPNLKATAQQGKSVATGKVREVGIGDIDGDTAVVFVAADGSVRNKNTKGKAEPRTYQFKMTMVREGDKWLTSDLQILG